MIMKTEHIKAISMITSISEMWKHFEFPQDDCWLVAFEVSEEFRRAFYAHMRGILHAQDIYESGLCVEDGLTEQEIDEMATFIYDGSSWFMNEAGTHLLRYTEYDDIMEKEVPEDWWMGNIALMKEVLAKTL
jgi:hypothetical protein